MDVEERIEEQVDTVEEQEEQETEETTEEQSEETAGEEETENADEDSEDQGEEGSEEEEAEEEEEGSEEEEVVYTTDSLIARAKEINPEATEENYQNVLGHRLAELEDYYSQNQAVNQQLVEVLEANDTVKDIMRDLISGADIRVAIARHFDPEELIPAEGDTDEAAWKEAVAKRKKALAEKLERTKEYETNVSESNQTITSFAEARQMSEEEREAFLGEVNQDLDSIYRGIVSEALLDRLYKGYRFESAVKKAEQVGEVKGRNAKIAKKKLETKKTGDGVPKVGSTQVTDEPSKPVDSIDRMLQRQRERQIL